MLKKLKRKILVGVFLAVTGFGLAWATHSADLNNDGQVNQADLTILISQWRSTGTADLNHDGTVSFADAGILFSNWGTIPPPPPSTTPVAHWEFNATSGTTAADSSGNGHTGTVLGGATWVAGRVGNALRFDGVNDAVQVADAPQLDVSQITVSAWVQKLSNAAGYNMLVSRQSGTGTGDLWILYYDIAATDDYRWSVRTSAGTSVVASGGPSTSDLNTWVHLAGTYDGSMVRLYKNGILVASAPHTGTIQAETANLCIGGGANDATRNCTSEFANAILDDVRLYNRALSITEIQALSGVTPATVPLRVLASNPRYFTDGSGRAIYLTGSHVWENLADRGNVYPPPPFDFTAYLNLLAANNHNFIRLWRWELSRTTGQVESATDYWDPHPWVRSGPGTALDGRPKFNLNSFHQAYFDRLRARVIAARDRGIYVGIMFFEGWNLRTSPSQWSNHPMNTANNINGINGDTNGDSFGLETQNLSIPAITAIQEAYVRKVIDTVNDLDNVLYEISNESVNTSEAWQDYMVDFINDYQATLPQQHPVGMTDLINVDNSVLFGSVAEWISPGLTVFSSADVYSVNPPATSGSKVELLDSDHTWNNAAATWGPPNTRADRVWVWKSFTRGYNPIYMDPIDFSQPNSIRSYAQVNASAILSARPAMGHTRTYATRINLAAMTPQGSLASTGYALASSGNEYLVYQPGSGSFTLNLSGTSGNFTVEWFNPATGTTSTGATVTGGATRTFTPPFSGDAVLYLRR